jgi:hypothetical protein
VLAVFAVQTEIPVRRRIAFELVGDQHTRRTTMLPGVVLILVQFTTVP